MDFGSNDAAQPVARVHFSGSAVQDMIQEFNLPGVLVAHIAEIQAQHGVGPRAAIAGTQQSLAKMRF
jgi:hypothetical protein